MAERELSILVRAKGALKAAGDIGKVDKATQGLTTRSIAAGTAIGHGIERLAEKGISFLFGQVRAGEEGLRNLQDISAQTGAVIESTGGKAGVSAAQVRELAEAQEALTTVDDKVIQSGENMLLTFTNIGSDVFPRATKAMVDMAVAMNGGNAEGIDLKSTSIQLGKALQDPIKGVTALRKVGVALSDQQQKQIKDFVEAGDVASAQAVILKELETEFGKAGEAAGKSGAAGVRRLSDAVEDSQIALATGLAPALDKIRGKIATALGKPETQKAIRNLGEWLGEAAEAGVAFAEKIPWGQVADGVKTAAGFAGKLVDAFVHMPPQVQGTILALAGLNKLSGGAVTGIVGELGKGLIKGVLGMTAGVVNLKAGVVNGGGGGVPGAGGGGGAVGNLVGAAGVAGVGILAANDIGVLAAGFGKGYQAFQQKDAQGMLAAERDIVSGMWAIPGPLRDIFTGIVDKLPPLITQPIAEPVRVLTDHQDALRTDTMTRLASIRDKAEANRIATVNSKTAIVAAAHSDKNALATVIRQNRPVVNLKVSVPVTVNSTTLRVTKKYTLSQSIGRNSGTPEFDH